MRNNTRKILAGILLYNPQIEVLSRNILNIENDVDGILLVDNASKNLKDVQREISSSKIEFLTHDENKGLPIAFNEMIDYATNNEYDCLLLLDQDSECSDGMVKELAAKIGNDYVCAVPLIIHKHANYQRKFGDKAKGTVENVEYSINSGTLINLRILPKTVRFNEKYFVDCVDFDFFLKLKKMGLRTLRVNTAELLVNLGNITEVPLFHFFLYNYSPFRLEKQMADRIAFVKRNWTEPIAKQTILLSIFNFFMIIFFEKNKMKKFFGIFKGLIKAI